MDDLLPCPCCESIAVELSWIDNDKPFALVSCDGCGLCMEQGGGHWQREYLESEAVKLWNTRPSSPLLHDAIEALEQIELLATGHTGESDREIVSAIHAIATAQVKALYGQPEDAWRPIESAPKHGTRILALWPYGKQQCAFETYWDADESQGDKPGWYAPGWGHILDGHEPIGWQPLPAPPATGGEDAPA